jgi:hypothetical protein
MTRSHLRRCSFVCTLAGLLSDLGSCPAVRKSEVRAGDMVLVRTRNSVYALRAQGRGEYRVSGGWFDRPGNAVRSIRVNGCTWGGSVIHAGLIAACGLHMEFDNRVLTSTVVAVAHLPAAQLN